MNGMLRIVGWLFAPVRFVLRLLLHARVWAVVMLALGVGVWGWRLSRQSDAPAPVPATLLDAVEAACRRVPPALPQPQRALRPTLVLPLADDRELLVTQGIRRALTRDGGYRPVGRGTAPQLMDELFELAGMPRQPVADATTALRIAKAAGAEVVVFGQVDRMELRDRHAEVVFSIQVFELGCERPISVGEFSSAPPPGLLTAATALPWALALGVLAVAGLWPLLMIPAMARVLKMESNPATLITIVGVTAVPAVVAWPLFFGTTVVAWRVIVFVLAVLLAGSWSALVMSRVAAREEAV